ncbi:MAG: hypothetical protein M0033_06750 [Nitrospiraceae bacterium]|nr:hypothetical protein [Nitrospiraceae bacterium]
MAEAPPKASHEPIVIEQAEGGLRCAVIDFENAAVSRVARVFGAVLGKDFVLAPGITGTMTIESYGAVPEGRLFDVFQEILEINGLKAELDGLEYRIVPDRSGGPSSGGMVFSGGRITGLIPLRHVKWSQVADRIRDLIPAEAQTIIYGPAGLLIVSAPPNALRRFKEIMEAVDVSGQMAVMPATYVYHVQNGEAGKLADVIRKVYRPGPAIRGRMLSVCPYNDINAIVMRCEPATYLGALKLLRDIDVPSRQVLIEVLVMQVELSDSTQFGLEWVLKNTGSKYSAAGGFSQGNVGIGPNGEPFANLANGFSAALTTTNPLAVAAALSSLATQNKVNVLASPRILAMDDKIARILVGSEIPIATGLIQQPSATISNTLVAAGQIRYKMIGTLLKVRPHITDKDKVTLDIEQEVSQIGQVVPVAGQNFQGFDVRRASTEASVQNGQTLLIGGLINETRNFKRAGIPFLSRIPVLGYLFSTTTTSVDRTELIVMVTPHVIQGREEAENITKEFEDRVRLIKKALAESKKTH